MRSFVPFVLVLAACTVDPGYQPGNDSQDQNNDNSGNDSGTFPIAPDNLHVANAWTVAELKTLTFPHPATVRTVIAGVEPIDLPVILEGFVQNLMTGSTQEPYLHLRIDGTNRFWATQYDVAAGMSGSPVIVDGRLAGALSFSYGGGAPGTASFAATPFEYMKRAGQRADGRISGFNSVYGSGTLYATGGGSRFFQRINAEGSGRRPVSTDLFRPAGGPIPGSFAGTAPALRAGSGVAVVFVQGDLENSGAVCTVTGVDGPNLWACGHPITAAGNIALPYSAAAVTDVISTSWYTFKLTGPVGNILGTIDGDWFPAIHGTTNRVAPTVFVQTTVRPTGSVARTFHHRISRLDPYSIAEWAAVDGVMLPLDADREAYAPGHAIVSIKVAYLETSASFVKTQTIDGQYDLALEAAWWAMGAFDEAFMPDANGQYKTPLQVDIDLTWDK